MVAPLSKPLVHLMPLRRRRTTSAQTPTPSPANPDSIVEYRPATRQSRVLLIVRTPPPYGGGEAVGELLRRLFEGTYNVLVFRRPQHDKLSQGRLTSENLLFGVRYIISTASCLLRSRPRVVYLDIPKDAASFLRSSIVVLASRAVGARVVGDLAGADFAFLQQRGPVRYYGRWVLGSVSTVRVLGDSVAATLRSHGVHQTAVIPNGIEDPSPPGRHTPPIFTNRWHFLYVGKIARAKGILTLIAFAQAYASEGRPFQLDIVGEWESAETRTEVEHLIQDCVLTNVVVLHGQLTGDAKWALYQQAHALLHPSHWDGQPVTILEALAFGVPVIATSVGAIPDTITSGHEGYLMQENTASEVTVGVTRILCDERTFTGYRERARGAFEQRFTATVFRDRMGQLLERQHVDGRDPKATHGETRTR